MAFFSTYALYKEGTRTVVNWLTATAARCGYETLQQKKKKKNKNKNKNRKLRAKGSVADQESSVPAAETESKPQPVVVPETPLQPSQDNVAPEVQSAKGPLKYAITSKELPLMAAFISENFQQISDFGALPLTLAVLGDVITKRKQWGTSFSKEDPLTSASNERHRHFVSILEEVQQILSGVMKALNIHQAQSQTRQADDTATMSVGENALNNIFAVLDLEDPSDAHQIIPEPSKKSQPLTVTSYELEEDDDDEETYIKILCFFRDFEDMRDHIRQSWLDYASGIVDLAAVAVATNVALEILQRAETELLESIPKRYNITGYNQIQGILYLAIAQSRGVEPTSRQQPEDVINMDLQDIADFTSMPVYILLSSFLPVLEGGPVPVMKPGYFGEIDRSGRPLSWRERFNQHKIALLDLLPDFCVVSKLGPPLPIMDELTRGLIVMVETRKIPIWLVLGSQLYLDIHDAMIQHPMGKIDMALTELQRMGQHASQTLQSYIKFSAKMSIDTWPKQNDQMLQYFKSEVDAWINKDAYFPSKKRQFQANKLDVSTIPPYSLFSKQPLLCGLLLFRLNMLLQDTGITLVNAWGSLPTVLHLYNAVKHESPNQEFPVWEDLEAVINIHGKNRIFIGDYPCDPEHYFKRFCLVMGWSASMLASNRREGRNTIQSQTPASNRGPREMIATSAVTKIFKPQYCDNKANSDVTFHRIQELLRESSTKQQRASPFLAVPFISSLQEKVQSDILTLNIDYIDLHMRCFDLLRNIHTTLHSDFVKYLQSPNYIEKESELPFLVGYLFMISTGSAKAADHLKIGGKGVEVRSKTLLKAADIVETLIRKEGNIEIKRVEEYCRGYDWLN
jgi:hypothetical protein